MVFFTCDACGESLKKGQVEKHLMMCRNCQCLSCIDCGKDFWGNDYKNHLKCISEDQKYGGKAFEAKANKGDVKQQQWLQRIHEVMNKPNITPNLKNILNQMSSYDNIPRKKAKFQNWMKNSLKINNQALQDQVWEIFSEATSNTKGAAAKDASEPTDKSTPEETPQPSETVEETKKSKRERKEERQKKNKKEKKDLNVEEPAENGTKKKSKKRRMEENQESDNEDRTDNKKKKKKKCENGNEEIQENGDEEPVSKKKRKREELQEQEGDAVENSMEENEEENGTKQGKFNWKGTIKAVLSQAPDNELPIKKLRKKVIAQYYTVCSAQHKSEEDILATFNKKISSNPKFRVLKERVKLIK